jgi:hypothetical protein
MCEYRMLSTPDGNGSRRESPSCVEIRAARPCAATFRRAFSHTLG